MKAQRQRQLQAVNGLFFDVLCGGRAASELARDGVRVRVGVRRRTYVRTHAVGNFKRASLALHRAGLAYPSPAWPTSTTTDGGSGENVPFFYNRARERAMV